jgi:hypothetical protein
VIFILDSGLTRKGAIKQVLTATVEEELNGINTLEFEAILDVKLASLIDELTVFEVNGQYYDTAYLEKRAEDTGEYYILIEAEHVSYRLNNEEFDIEFFTEMGTPNYILTQILADTPFSISTVEPTVETVYSAQQDMTRRQLAMEFVASLDCDVVFNNFQVSLLNHRGSTTPKPTIFGKHVESIMKTVDKRKKDKDGNVYTNYTCRPMALPNSVYYLGDMVRLIDESLGINLDLRLVSITTDPYDISKTKIQFSNYENSLAKSLYRVTYDKVVLDQFYNGSRIGPQFGFESVRNDKMARSYFRSDGMKFQTGDGTGENWTDRLYYEYNDVTNETILVFDGVLSSHTIEALKAEIDITVSNTIIVNNLYAEYGRVANLSVAELDTSWKKITNYLLKNIDVNASRADVNYQRIYEDRHETWTAKVAPNNNPIDLEAVANGTTINLTWDNTPSGDAVQYTTKEGTKLYWVDNTLLKSGMTTNVTPYPVMVYTYEELMKRVDSVELINGLYIPTTWYGAGSGVNNNGKAHIYKDQEGFHIIYYNSITGEPTEIKFTDNGFFSTNESAAGLKNIDIAPVAPVAPKNNDLWIDTSGL